MNVKDKRIENIYESWLVLNCEDKEWQNNNRDKKRKSRVTNMKANFDPEPKVIFDCFHFGFVSCKMSDIPH